MARSRFRSTRRKSKKNLRNTRRKLRNTRRKGRKGGTHDPSQKSHSNMASYDERQRSVHGGPMGRHRPSLSFARRKDKKDELAYNIEKQSQWLTDKTTKGHTLFDLDKVQKAEQKRRSQSSKLPEQEGPGAEEQAEMIKEKKSQDRAEQYQKRIAELQEPRPVSRTMSSKV